MICIRNVELYYFQVPGLIKPEFVKPGSIVIDVGINRIMVDGKAKIVGDVDPKVLLLFIFFLKIFFIILFHFYLRWLR